MGTFFWVIVVALKGELVMTYAELLKELQSLDSDRLNDTVTVYINDRDEFFPISEFQIAVGDVTDVIDDGHA